VISVCSTIMWRPGHPPLDKLGLAELPLSSFITQETIHFITAGPIFIDDHVIYAQLSAVGAGTTVHSKSVLSCSLLRAPRWTLVHLRLCYGPCLRDAARDSLLQAFVRVSSGMYHSYAQRTQKTKFGRNPRIDLKHGTYVLLLVSYASVRHRIVLFVAIIRYTVAPCGMEQPGKPRKNRNRHQ